MKTSISHIIYKNALKAATVCAFLLLSTIYSGAYPDPYYDQNFEDWPVQLTFTNTSYNGWYITDGCVRPRRNTPPNTWLFDAHSSSNMAGLNAPLPNGGSPRKSLQTPTMNDGAGYVSFYYRNALSSEQYFELQYSTNSGASWITNSSITSSSTNWTHFGTNLNIYAPVSVKIEKTGDNNTSSQWLLLDTVSIELPDAYALISEVQLYPTQPIPNTTQLVLATIEPQVYGSNTTAKVVYSTNNWATYAEASMTETSANHYVTAPGITGIDNPGLIVDYYIDVMLDGPTTNNTHSYWPPGAPSTKASYQVRAKPYASSYASMTVTGGPPATAMMLQDDYIWRGVTPLGIYTNPSFNFQSGATIWGDIDQSSTTHPLTGIAETSGTIDLTGTVTNHLAFIFNETATNTEYSIQSCEYAFFDDLAGATNFSSYTNSEQWVMLNARTTASGETNKALTGAGMSAVLRGASNGVLRTPFLGTGIGVVSFYMRNWLEDGSAPVKMSIEKSFDASTWIPVTSIDSILTPDYIFYSINLNDDTNRYIRIVNTSASITNYLCLDNVSATAPGAFVKLSNPTIVPAAPTFSPQPVNVTIDFVKSDTATNLEGRLYWKAPDSDDYDWMMMSTTGSTFYGQIPPTIGGTVFYYFECIYDGFNATPVQYPQAGTNAPLSFSASSNIISSLRQDFEAWPAQLTFTNASYNGWNITNGCIRPKKTAPPNIWPYDPYEGTKMAGLNAPLADGAFPRFGITSPLFTNGVSLVAFACRSAFDTTFQTLEVQSSIDLGASWTTNATISVTSTNYTLQRVQVDTFSPTHIRIEKTGDGGTVGQYLIIDDITCAPPSADVIITNHFMTPGYPGTGNTVTVSCDIFTKSEIYRAFNFRPKLAFTKDGTWITNAMSQVGSNTWSGTIDAQPPVKVEYFIRCDFAGYYYTNGAVSTRRSPAFYPPGSPTQDQPDSFLSYVPQRFASAYSNVFVTPVSGYSNNVNMSLVGDNYWQGIFNWEALTSTQLVLNLSGLGYFTGSGFSSETNFWGDDSQTFFDTPLSGIASQDASSIVVNIDTSSLSQVVLLFNTTNGYYEVRRGAYQDFNGWSAKADEKFTLSYNSPSSAITNKFDDWPTNAVVTRPAPLNQGQANFEDPNWATNTSSFITGPIDPFRTIAVDDRFWLKNFRVVNDVNTNHAAEFNPAGGGALWPDIANLMDGLGTLTWRAKCRYQDNYLTWYTNGLGWSNYYVKATLVATDPGVAYPRLSVFANYQNASNYFEAYLMQTNTTQIAIGIRSFSNGIPSQIGSPKTITTTLKTTQTLTFSVSPRASNGAYLHLKLDSSTTVADGTTSSTHLNSGGSIALLCDDTDIIVDDISVRPRTIRSFNDLPDEPFSTYNYDNWIFNNAQRTGDECRLNNNTNATIESPTLPFTPEELRFGCAGLTYTNGAFVVEGFNGITWTNVGSVYTNVPTGSWITNSSPAALSGYSRLRLRNASTNAVIRIDYIWITAGTNTYTESFTNATSTNAWAAPYGFWELDSANQYYKRQAYCGPEINFRLDVSTNVPPTSPPYFPDELYWTTNVFSFSISNHQYQSYSTNVNMKYWGEMFPRIAQTTAGASLMIDDVTMSSWHGQDFESNGWATTEGWIAKVGTTNHVELWRSRANPSMPQTLRTPRTSNGVANIEFEYSFEGLNGVDGTFNIEWDTAPESTNATWTSLTNWTVSATNNVWPKNYYLDINTTNSIYLRVLHTTPTNTAIMKIDNFKVTDYVEKDERTWVAYNARITASDDLPEFEPLYANTKTAYLNNDASTETLDGPFTNSVPYIQSGRVGDGVGLVSFWYRSWESDGNPPGEIKIFTSNDPEAPATNWTERATIGNIVNTDYRLYQTNFYITEDTYVRVTASTNGSTARICIDNILVAQPLGADFTVQLIEITPSVPLYTNSVKVAANIGRFIMNPNTISGKVYYHVGTNDWGNLGNTWLTNDYWLPMSPVEYDAGGRPTRFESVSNIPPQSIDTVVQYYVEFTFNGTFAQSPKQGRIFTNPSWYFPVNLNSNKAIVNPYYYSFACGTNDVWINEFNYYTYGPDETNEYVEIAGKSGVNLSGWHIDLQEYSGGTRSVYDSVTISNGVTLANETNGFGFFVWGDPTVGSQVDQAFTNPVAGNLKDSGGIVLKRSMGIWADAVAYGYNMVHELTNGVNFDYTFAGDKTTFGPLMLAGTGSTEKDFYWYEIMEDLPGYIVYVDTINFAGQANGLPGYTQQVFVAVSYPEDSIIISNFWMTASNTYLVFTSTITNEFAPKAWYTTNLINTNWVFIPSSYNYSPSSGIYTQYFSNLTNTPPLYFRVTSTNSP